MKSIKDIVIESIDSNKSDTFSRDNFNKILLKHSDGKNEIEIENMISATIDISSQYSELLLLDVLTKLEKEGYLRN